MAPGKSHIDIPLPVKRDMNAQRRNNVRIYGKGPETLVFVYSFGFDQGAWKYLNATFSNRFKIVLLDLVGSDLSDLAAYDPLRHATLDGHVKDLIDALAAVAPEPVVLVGHSVGATIGMLASIAAPERFKALVMIGPSPSLINEADYVGGFERQEIGSLLESLESNFLGWSSTMAPAILGEEAHRDTSILFASTFSTDDLDIAKHFARVTFLYDHRADLVRVTVPTLIVQSTHDPFVPPGIGLHARANTKQRALHNRQRRTLPSHQCAGRVYSSNRVVHKNTSARNRWTVKKESCRRLKRAASARPAVL